jgi:hypothetical protein
MGPLARYGLGTQLPFNLRCLVAGDVAALLGKMELRDPIDSTCESVAMVKYHLRLVERHHWSAGFKDAVRVTAVLVSVFCYFR